MEQMIMGKIANNKHSLHLDNKVFFGEIRYNNKTFYYIADMVKRAVDKFRTAKEAIIAFDALTVKGN